MMEFLSEFASWMMDVLLWLPRQLFSEFMGGMLQFLQMIPSPEFALSLAQSVAQVPEAMKWWMGMANLGTGAQLVGGAYVGRFLLRRIPLIG